MLQQIISGIAQGLVQRLPLAREVSKRLTSMLADAIAQSVRRVFVAFWTGSMLTAIVIMGLCVIAISIVAGMLPLSASGRSGFESTLYTLVVAAFLLRLLTYVVSGGSRR
jgi:hypothetical protein